MSDKYKVHIGKVQHGGQVRAASGQQMNKVTDTLLDVTKVAVVSGAAIGVMGAAGTLLKK
jgi:hypothetical protein